MERNVEYGLLLWKEPTKFGANPANNGCLVDNLSTPILREHIDGKRTQGRPRTRWTDDVQMAEEVHRRMHTADVIQECTAKPGHRLWSLILEMKMAKACKARQAMAAILDFRYNIVSQERLVFTWSGLKHSNTHPIMTGVQYHPGLKGVKWCVDDRKDDM